MSTLTSGTGLPILYSVAILERYRGYRTFQYQLV
jgi:hypothetical protein